MSYTPLSYIGRFYIYGLQGVFTEVFYTALWELAFARNRKLIGVSSIWAFFIYAFSQMFIERIHPKLISYRIPVVLRGLVYLVWTYFWEFSTGYTLKMFDSCPWDYETTFSYHFFGVITLEYAPFWYFGSIIAERIFIPAVNQLNWSPSPLRKNRRIKNANKSK